MTYCISTEMNSSHFSDKRICIKDVIVFGLRSQTRFPPRSRHRMRSVPYCALLQSGCKRFVSEYRIERDLPSWGREKKQNNNNNTFSSLQKAIVHGLNARSSSSTKGIWYFELTFAGWSCGRHSFGGRCFLCIFSLVNSTAWGNIFIPLWPIVHNSHRQRATHEKTRRYVCVWGGVGGRGGREGGGRGEKHSVGISTDSSGSGRSLGSSRNSNMRG